MQRKEQSSGTVPVLGADAEDKIAAANASSGERDASATSERVAELVEAALEQGSAERAQFLEHACGNDAHLRSEVESLLRYQEKARDFIGSPAYQIAPELLR